jgi:hypothetical protein
MKSLNAFAVIGVLVLSMSVVCALHEDTSATIKSELENKGLAARVVYVENSTYGLPGYVIVINVTDGDYVTATRRAMVAAANGGIGNYPNCAIIGLIGPSEKAYQIKINNIDMPDIRYETFDNNLDASKDRAERYFDSAIVTTPQKLEAYFGTQ